MATPEKTEKNKMHFMRPGQDGWDFLAGLRYKQDSAHVARECCIKHVQDARKVLEMRSARLAQLATKRRRRGRALLPYVALASGQPASKAVPACKNRLVGAPTRRDVHSLCHTGGRGASQNTHRTDGRRDGLRIPVSHRRARRVPSDTVRRTACIGMMCPKSGSVHKRCMMCPLSL